MTEAGRRHGAERLRATTGKDGRALPPSEAAQHILGAPHYLVWVHRRWGVSGGGGGENCSCCTKRQPGSTGVSSHPSCAAATLPCLLHLQTHTPRTLTERDFCSVEQRHRADAADGSSPAEHRGHAATLPAPSTGFQPVFTGPYLNRPG